MAPDNVRTGVRTALWAILLAELGAGFVLHASFPGYLNADSFSQLLQIEAGRFDDWHSPTIALIWSMLTCFFPGPVGFMVADNLLIWGSLAALAVIISRQVGAAALLVLAIPLMPGTFNFLGHVVKDTMLVGWLLAAFASAFWSHCEAQGSTRERAGRWLATAFTFVAFLVRPNVIFATIPLLLYANSRLGFRRNLLRCIFALALMPVVLTVQNRLIDVEARHPSDSIKTYQLLALSYFSGKNLIPGDWSSRESELIVRACYSPNQWDNAGSWGSCGFIHQKLVVQGIWGSATLTRAWLKGLATHPLQAYAAMAASFRLSMREPNSRVMLYEPPATRSTYWPVETNPPRATTDISRQYMLSPFNDQLSRPWVFVVLFCASAIILLWRNLVGTPLGLLATSLTASGATFLLTYFPFSVSVEYRYFYWCGFAAYLSLLCSVFAMRATPSPELAGGANLRPVRIGLCLLISLSVALAAAPFKLPTAPLQVRIEPLDGRPVTVTELRSSSTPLWVWPRIEGRIDAPGWNNAHGQVHSPGNAAPLTATLTTLLQGVRLKLATGPDRGLVRVETDEQAVIIDTYAEEAGELTRGFISHERISQARRDPSPGEVFSVLLLFVVSLRILLWLDGRKRVRRETR